MFIRIALVALLVAGAWSAAQAAPKMEVDLKVHEYTLDNGLKVLVRVDRRAPVVVSQVWYRVGSSHEFGGVTGISHVLEHMMFKGTPRYPAGEFSRLIQKAGGRDNAFTSRDYTAYHQQLERSRLPLAIELEADRMRNLTLPEDEFEKEIEVVKEERRLRTEDNARALTFEHFRATAFTSSPYRQPVIGWMDDLDNMTVADLHTWYRRFYVPNNAILVVAGDVDPQAVFNLAELHFGRHARGDLPEIKPRTEAPPRGPRRSVVRAPAELPYVLIGYHVPTLMTAEDDWEPYALQVLAGVLSGSTTARLNRELVREARVAAGASAGYNLYARLSDLFVLSGTPAEGREVQELEEALLAQIERLQREPVDPQELERIKAQVVASEVYQNDSVFAQAMRIGALETVGHPWQLAEEFVERIQAVTPEQIMAVARKYLVENSRTVTNLDPLPLAPGERAVAPSAETPDALELTH
ncbi:insulinase family protein [Ectothiorhodospiraceae bacterium 2226]|nr:insulinase family protein [Ectothiorhodospiraceae bacterium 2226]